MTPAEMRAYARRRRAALARGTWEPPVPAHTVTDHIRDLRARGMSVAAIATAAGLANSTVAPLAYPDTHSARRRTVSPHTARALLAVHPDQSPPWAHIPNVGTRRRIEALQWMGWPLSEIAARLGVTTASVSATKRQPRVTVAKADRIDAVYRQLAMSIGPDLKTRTWARKSGYVSPLAWDDIDDPAERPQGHGHARDTVGLDLDEWVRIVRLGECPERAAQRCGVSLAAVERAAYRHGRTDVLDRLRRAA